MRWAFPEHAGVDSEHRELMDLINRLHAQLLEPGAGTSVMDFLGELFAKISSHFALEEKLMRDGGYAAYPAHKADLFAEVKPDTSACSTTFGISWTTTKTAFGWISKDSEAGWSSGSPSTSRSTTRDCTSGARRSRAAG